jgi:copper chaperone CopZ
MTETSLQLLVNMKCESCSNKIQKEIEKHKEISKFSVDLENNFVFVTTTLTNGEIVKIIENLGFEAKIHGQNVSKNVSEGAVGVFLSQEIECVVRFIQIDKETILIDTNIIKLPKISEKNEFQFKIHEFGDISKGSSSCGNPIIELQEFQFSGEQKTFQNISNFQVYSIIGRSIILYFQGKDIGCSVLARTAGVLMNTKRGLI